MHKLIVDQKVETIDSVVLRLRSGVEPLTGELFYRAELDTPFKVGDVFEIVPYVEPEPVDPEEIEEQQEEVPSDQTEEFVEYESIEEMEGLKNGVDTTQG